MLAALFIPVRYIKCHKHTKLSKSRLAVSERNAPHEKHICVGQPIRLDRYFTINYSQLPLRRPRMCNIDTLECPNRYRPVIHATFGGPPPTHTLPYIPTSHRHTSRHSQPPPPHPPAAGNSPTVGSRPCAGVLPCAGQ